ncbi:VWA domain-containing protein, partial [Xanthomonas citri pv. citri]|nr:VWA domain-containing protein [Xanthomonas citri pv. citri]
QMRRVVEPLARKLAARMAAKRRRASHGRIDIRKTLRASMSTGGVPIAPVYDHRTPNRSELVILAVMSCSVSGFSRFTILLMQAMQAQFARVRV